MTFHASSIIQLSMIIVLEAPNDRPQAVKEILPFSMIQFIPFSLPPAGTSIVTKLYNLHEGLRAYFLRADLPLFSRS